MCHREGRGAEADRAGCQPGWRRKRARGQSSLHLFRSFTVASGIWPLADRAIPAALSVPVPQTLPLPASIRFLARAAGPSISLVVSPTSVAATAPAIVMGFPAALLAARHGNLGLA